MAFFLGDPVMSYFRNRQAVITGAASGIGRALAQELNRQGCALWLSDVNEAGLAETQASLPRSDVACDIRVVDVASREAMEAWADDISRHTDAVHIVINNAGVAHMGLAWDTDYADFHWLMNINFWGVVHGCRAFLPLLTSAPQSHLVNISSVFGMIGVPTQSAYNAAKFAVKGYSEALRLELAQADSPISLLCVHPGGIDTNIARNARNADPSASADSQHATFAPHVRTSAESAAQQILRAAKKRRPRLLIGPDARVIDWVVRLFPAAYTRLLGRRMDQLAP